MLLLAKQNYLKRPRLIQTRPMYHFRIAFKPIKNTYTFKSITKVKGNSDEDNILLVDISFTNNEETATTPYMGFAVDWDLQQTNDNKNESLSPVDLK